MRKILAVFLVLALSGCSVNIRQGGRGFLPEIPVPERPKLKVMTEEEFKDMWKVVPPAIIKKTQDNFRAMHEYASKLEAGVKKYNAHAKGNNELVRKELGYAKEKVESGRDAKEEGK